MCSLTFIFQIFIYTANTYIWSRSREWRGPGILGPARRKEITHLQIMGAVSLVVSAFAESYISFYVLKMHCGHRHQ